MTLIVVRNKKCLAIPDLMKYVLKFIYEDDQMSASDIRLMKESVVTWKQHIDYKREIWHANKKIEPDIQMSPADLEIELQLQELGFLLQKNQDGEYNDRKRMFKEHNISYLKFHRVPGSVTQEDRQKAESMKQAYDKKNPEQEGLIKTK